MDILGPPAGPEMVASLTHLADEDPVALPPPRSSSEVEASNRLQKSERRAGERGRFGLQPLPPRPRRQPSADKSAEEQFALAEGQ
eukprot:1894917-Rhodomonas_salina.1